MPEECDTNDDNAIIMLCYGCRDDDDDDDTHLSIQGDEYYLQTFSKKHVRSLALCSHHNNSYFIRISMQTEIGIKIPKV